MTSSEDEDLCTHPGTNAGPHSWAGGEINIKRNGEIVATILSGFDEFEHCFRVDQIDKINDQFQLQSTATDGVCITSLTVNGKQLLVGKNNDRKGFWIDGNQNDCLDDFMATSQITIQNGLGKISKCC